MDTVIAARGLTKRFGRKTVVDRLDLEVPAGAIFALLGDNGAGKSTTIRMLTGQFAPESGQASILGQDAWAKAYDLRHRIGYVPEKPRYYDWMTVEEIGWFSAGFHRPGYRDRYRTLTARFRLGGSAKLKTLSKGGYAKVGLALALASDPEVLILDEPTSGLDLFTRREFLSSMVELAGEGRTILISSHSVSEVERVASHAAFLSAGRIVLTGTLEDLRQKFVGVRLLASDTAPDPLTLGIGQVVDCDLEGREWKAAVLDPDRAALAELRHREGILDCQEMTLSLEEMYTALLARYHRAGVAEGQRDATERGEGRAREKIISAQEREGVS